MYRVALWHPEFVTHIFAICTPYTAPTDRFVSLETIISAKLPNFGYQIQLASGTVENHIQTKEEIKQFLNAMYGGKGQNGESGFDVTRGIIFQNLKTLDNTRLMRDEVLAYYADQYARNGMHGTCKSFPMILKSHN